MPKLYSLFSHPATKLLISFLMASIIFFNMNQVTYSFENLAMGTETSEYQAKDKLGDTIHFLRLGRNEINQFESMTRKKNDSITFFLGNSQSSSINQMKNSDCNYIELISNKAPNPCLAVTMANANLQEMLVTTSYVLPRLKIKKIVIPIFMDDLRGDGVKEYFFRELFQINYQLNYSSNIAKQINLILKNKDSLKKSNGEEFLSPQDCRSSA